MAYTPQTWTDGSAGNTPISAARLTVMENGIAAASTPNAAAITDSTSVGRSVLTATDAGAARSAIAAGTSSLVLGTASGTAAAGDDSRITGAPALAAALERHPQGRHQQSRRRVDHPDRARLEPARDQ